MESVSLLNRGVWGDWAFQAETLVGFLLPWIGFFESFSAESQDHWCVGFAGLHFFGFVHFSGGSDLRSARASAVETQFSMSEAATTNERLEAFLAKMASESDTKQV